MVFYIGTKKDDEPEKIIKEDIESITIYNNEQGEIYHIKDNINAFKEVFENENIEKIGIDLSKTYILLKQMDVTIKGIKYDAGIAGYVLNPTNNKLDIENLIDEYLQIDISKYLNLPQEDEQINLFDSMNNSNEEATSKAKQKIEKYGIYAYSIWRLREITLKKLEKINALELFQNIDMPTVEVLSNMQWNGMYVDEEELNKFGKELSSRLEVLTKKIYESAGEEFNINSTKQLGEKRQKADIQQMWMF